MLSQETNNETDASKDELINKINQGKKLVEEAQKALDDLERQEIKNAYQKFDYYENNEELIIALMKYSTPATKRNVLAIMQDSSRGSESERRASTRVTAAIRDSVKSAIATGDKTQAAIADIHGISLATLAKIKRGDYENL